MAAELDEQVESFRHRPLGQAGPFTSHCRRRVDDEGPRGRARGQRRGAAGHRGQR
ncbi:hypothetical protein [Micrococcus terreus]|uniref:hypothetical protein n=1 Tax=Micrococcus terreus TaxID=574650 RepID=UPI00254B4D3E|nr:hypothetical protein [Micrococcus terreus]MDK7700170.1 hypothetical protein [Micrococcus terreus]WOO99011.1 hypothetical protein R3I42_10685 [Micrococcus terreus]